MTYLAYRMLARFAEVLPMSAIGPVSNLVARLALLTRRKQARLVRRHLQRAQRFDPSPDQVRAAFASYVRYWLESFRLPVVPAEILAKQVTVKGYEKVESAVAEGKGVVFALPHMGNWDAAGAWLTARGLPLTVVVERLEPPKLSKWFMEFRKSMGFSVVFNDSRVAASLTSALKRNEAIALLCDRDVDSTGMPVEFFDEVTTLPRGPALLARRTGAALFPVATYVTPTGYELVVDEPVASQRSNDAKADVVECTKELTARIEKLIEAAPEQWHLFQPNWPSERSR
jgi:phosphatidylinositol dimannoside acyltransferase